MKKILVLCVLISVGLVSAAQARVLLSSETTCTGTDVTVTTTDEKVIATQVVPMPQGQTFLMRIRFWGTMTTSANSTTYTLKVRRDSLSGTALGDSIAETVKVTAGSVEAFFFEFTDERNGQFAALTYVSTIDMAGADANTTVSQNCITVDVLQ